MDSNVDAVIPIYKAGDDFVAMLEKLNHQTNKPKHIYLLQTIEKNDDKLFDKKMVRK